MVICMKQDYVHQTKSTLSVSLLLAVCGKAIYMHAQSSYKEDTKMH